MADILIDPDRSGGWQVYLEGVCYGTYASESIAEQTVEALTRYGDGAAREIDLGGLKPESRSLDWAWEDGEPFVVMESIHPQDPYGHRFHAMYYTGEKSTPRLDLFPRTRFGVLLEASAYLERNVDFWMEEVLSEIGELPEAESTEEG